MRAAVALPDSARTKLNELQLARMAAEDAARSANTRILQLAHDADQQMRDRLAAERDKQSYRQNQLGQLTSRLVQWASELRADTVLEPVPPLVIEHKSGGDLIAALNTCREEIAKAKQKLQKVRI
jgi:hypothetical protein